MKLRFEKLIIWRWPGLATKCKHSSTYPRNQEEISKRWPRNLLSATVATKMSKQRPEQSTVTCTLALHTTVACRLFALNKPVRCMCLNFSLLTMFRQFSTYFFLKQHLMFRRSENKRNSRSINEATMRPLRNHACTAQGASVFRPKMPWVNWHLVAQNYVFAVNNLKIGT